MSRKMLIFLAVICLAGAQATLSNAAFRIQPGPAELSAGEKAIRADPEARVQHGVILLLEMEHDDPVSGFSKFSYHMRAKILSNAARSLGDVEVPMDSRRGYLRKFWARTIHPDGRVDELEKEDLQEQTVVRSQGAERRVLKGAMPGLEPGCVIDYGWVIQTPGGRFFRRIPLQRRWPIRELRYRWLPSGRFPSQYYLRRRPGLEIEVKRERQAILIEAAGLPPVIDEPWGPPEDLLRAGVILYYSFGASDSAEDQEKYWDDMAQDEERDLAEFLKRDRLLKETLASMNLAPQAPLHEKLAAVYDWIGKEIRNLALRSAEEREAEAEEEDEDRKDRASVVLETKEGWPYQMEYLFIGFARALGATAHVVRVPDRTEGYWDKGLLSRGQFSGRVVALWGPGQSVENAIFADLGSGLPYGMVPWWFAPARALMATEEGARDVILRTSDPRRNVLETRVSVDLGAPEGIPVARWTVKGSGHRGNRTRRGLIRRSSREREERLQELCGASGELEILSAESPGLEIPGGEYALECEGEMTGLDGEVGLPILSMGLEGPWIPDLPEFPSEEREHPVVFNYPWIDISVIDVKAPEGYAMEKLPEPVTVQGPFGSYAMGITRTPGGARIERAFAVVRLTVKPEDYGELRGFIQRAASADRARLAFKREGE